MKTRSRMIGAMVVACAMGFALSQRAVAVTDQEFNELKTKVNQLMGTSTNAPASLQPVHPVPGGAISATHNFMVVGDAEIAYAQTEGQHGAFLLSDFAPIFLFRAGDNVLFEAGFDVALQNQDGGGSSTAVDLSFAQLDYLLNDYLEFVGGYMVLPLGTYSERSAGWLNKLPDDPLPRDVLPGTGAGVQLRGSAPVGRSGQSVSYSLYVVNGPSSIDGTGNGSQTNGDPNLDLGGNVGVKSDGSTGNVHGRPSVGGRLGWFGLWKPHYDLELGVSGQSGDWNDDGNERWSAGVVDATLHLGASFEARGEYIRTWQQTEDQGTLEPEGWWVQAAYKLAGLDLDLPMVNSVELVGRYDQKDDGFGPKTKRTTAGVVYHFTATLQGQGAYEFVRADNPDDDHNQWILQLAFGF